MLSAAEIEKRLPAWHALSDLFLDTELQPTGYRHIARVLGSSGYSPAELRAILDEEVAPVFVSNLLSVAGEWAGWGEEDVCELMLHSLRRRWRLPLLSWLKRRIHRRHVAEEWAKIERFLDDA